MHHSRPRPPPSSPASARWPSPSPSYYTLSLSPSLTFSSLLALIFRIKESHFIEGGESRLHFFSLLFLLSQHGLIPIQWPHSLSHSFSSLLVFLSPSLHLTLTHLSFISPFFAPIVLSHSFPFPKYASFTLGQLSPPLSPHISAFCHVGHCSIFSYLLLLFTLLFRSFHCTFYVKKLFVHGKVCCLSVFFRYYIDFRFICFFRFYLDFFCLKIIFFFFCF